MSTSIPAATPQAPELNQALAYHHAGRLAEAAAIYRKVLDQTPDHPDALHLLGMVMFQQGDSSGAIALLTRALAQNGEAAAYHHDLGDVLRGQERFDEAIASYRKALALDPDFHASHVNLAALLQQRGAHAEAVEHYDRALALVPDGADLHYNAGNALREQGDLDAAAARYRTAFALQPKHWPALFNLGHTLQMKGATAEAAAAYRRVVALEPKLAAAHFNLAGLYEHEGRVDEAIAAYRAALQSFPDSPDAHNNLANLLAGRGRADEALAGYARALALKPDFAEAHNNLGNLQQNLGRSDEALVSLRRALALKPLPAFKANFARALSGHVFTRADADLRPFVLEAMVEPWARPADVAGAAASLLRADPVIGACVQRAATAETTVLAELLAPGGAAAFVNDPLFVALLISAPVSDVGFERLLTRARTSLWAEHEPGAEVLAFAALLARQCHLNDHVFASTAAENASAEEAHRRVEDALANGRAPAAFDVVRLACYLPLAAFREAQRLLEYAWAAPLSPLLREAVAEPLEEARLAQALPALTPIEDATSKRVRKQYEEHPYPRWTQAAPIAAASTFDSWLHMQLPGAPFKPLADDGALDVLIAGCGTGQHVLETARRFPRARILAIDLSRTSLGYAARKAHEATLANVVLAQADLLALGATGRAFDVIEAAGVLHHLADPSAGWRSLVSVLRPGGFLLAALYGERARESIVAARDYAAAHGYAATAADIRRFRQEALVAPAPSPLARLAMYRDFYSTSECRDMLFHVEEHRTTIPAIKALLADLGLRFVGFQLPPSVVSEYARRYPKDRSRTDLDQWHAFESDVPGAFPGMYEFWVQKPASP